MSEVFGVMESNIFAKALAADNGISVRQSREPVEPHVVGRRAIIIGPPTLVGHKRYMQQLHSELSKCLPEVQFFYDTEYEEGSIQEVVRNVLHAQRSEYAMQGLYAGRDRILQERYADRMQSNGGVRNVASVLGAQDKTIGALMFLDNELRNEWQGYLYAECPPELQGEVDRLRPIVEHSWLQLSNRVSLETLIKEIIQDENRQETGENPEQGDSGRSGDPDGGHNQEAGQGDPDAAEGDPDDAEGDPDDAGGDPDDAEGDQDADDLDGDDSEGSLGDTEDTEGEGLSDPSEGFEDEGDEIKEVDVQQGAESRKGGGAASQLSAMGIVKDALKAEEKDFQLDNRTYVPSSDVRHRDITQEQSVKTDRAASIESTLGSFNLSKKIRKYLITMSQSGYEYGLKKGRLCNKHVSRVLSGAPEPRIFKEKQAARIQTDTAWFILGDVSGSMSGSKYMTSASCQIASSETLQTLRIPHMMGQFSTSGSVLRHFTMKHFGESSVSRDKLIKRYGSNSVVGGCNADGEAVVWAATELAKRKESKKILLVLSDGYPAHTDGDSGFLRDVVRDIRDNSTMTIIGIGIQSEAVKDFYPEYRVVSQVSDLEGVLVELLKTNVLGG